MFYFLGTLDVIAAFVGAMKGEDSKKRIRFRLALPAERYLAYYQGSAQDVVVRADDNRVIRFPADAIRQFVTHDGVFGDFEITFDAQNKLVSIRRVD
ncbi:MAG: DUF2835 domain-containing protein [Pseudomonadota bacterium]